MANENAKPQPGDAGSGARSGEAGRSEPGRDAGGPGERSGPREGSEFDDPRREQGDTKAPRRRS